MSAAATFEFQSDLSTEEIKQRTHSLWDSALGEGYCSEVFRQPDSVLTVRLYWFFGDSREQEQAREIIRYLLSVSVGGGLHYLRDEAFIRGVDPDYPRPISIDEVFQSDFCPGMHNGIQYRHLIRGQDGVATNT